MSNDDSSSNGAGAPPFADWMRMWAQMPQQAPAGWQNAMEQWRTQMASQFGQLAQNEEFLHAVGQQLTGTFLFKEQMDRVMEQQLSAMQLPTSSDIKALRRRIRTLDDRLEDLTDQMEDLHDTLRKIAVSSGTNASDGAALEAAKVAAEAASFAGQAAQQAASAAREAAAAVKSLESAQAPADKKPRKPRAKKSTKKAETGDQA